MLQRIRNVTPTTWNGLNMFGLNIVEAKKMFKPFKPTLGPTLLLVVDLPIQNGDLP